MDKYLVHNLRPMGTHHDDFTVAHEAADEIEALIVHRDSLCDALADLVRAVEQREGPVDDRESGAVQQAWAVLMRSRPAQEDPMSDDDAGGAPLERGVRPCQRNY
jgi:hypothetical protein